MMTQYKMPKDYPDLLDKRHLGSFLKSIVGKSPSGVSLRYEADYDVIQKARKVEADLPQGVWTHDLKEADWEKVEATCRMVLLTKSKDIQVSLWLTEAWFHRYHVYGLLAGLTLTKALLTEFWDSFHPFSEDDPEYRLSPLLWFDREMSKALTQVIVAMPQEDGHDTSTFWDYQSKVLLTPTDQGAEGSSGQKNQRSEEGEAFYAAVKQTPTAYYDRLTRELMGCLDVVRDIETLVATTYRDFPGCLMHVRGRLEKIYHFAKTILNERPTVAVTPVPPLAPVVEAPVKKSLKEKMLKSFTKEDRQQMSMPMTFSLPPQDTPIQNRQHAYALLGQIADYLAEIEPHSPTPYLIRRAVNWGDMSLGALMTELIQQTGDMQTAMKVLGMDQSK